MRCLLLFVISLQLCIAVEQPLNESDLLLNDGYEAAVQTAMISEKNVTEVSGLVCSHGQKDLLWVINDSGNEADIIGLSKQGQQRAIITLDGIGNRDWESMGRFTHEKKRYLVVADCGDNMNILPVCALYIFEEPIIDQLKDDLQQIKLSPQRIIHYAYEDGPRDCEAIFVNVQTKEIVLISKRDVPARVYTLPLFPKDDKKIAATYVA